MGVRFQRRLKLFPGVRLNFSRGGISTTIGVRGASLTLGGRGAYVNLGIPGTGLSFRQKITHQGDGRSYAPLHPAHGGSIDSPSPPPSRASPAPEAGCTGDSNLPQTLPGLGSRHQNRRCRVLS
jgi:Protein of unknown function (DUF4236)